MKGTHQRHLPPKYEVTQAGRRKPSLLAADMAVHMQACAAAASSPLCEHLVPARTLARYVMLKDTESGQLCTDSRNPPASERERILAAGLGVTASSLN